MFNKIFTPSALQNYARWQLVRLFVPSLDQECVNAFQQFTNVITNNGIPEREEMCVGMVQEYLPLAVWRPYADTVVTTNAQVSYISSMCLQVSYIL